MAWFEHGTSRIYYEESGSGEPVLLLPGWSGSMEEFSALGEVLVTAGYRVIAADMPGSGRSLPQPRNYTATYYEDDSRSFMALLRHLEIESAHLMGFSDGGEVSLLMAALTPSIARSVVTWGAAGVIYDPQGVLINAMANIVDDPIPPMQGLRAHLIATYGEANARLMTRSAAKAFSDIIDQGGDISLSKVGNITCPVLLITGDHDFLATPALVSELAAGIAMKEVVVVKDAGHEPLHNTRAEWFAQTILDWLKQTSSVRS